VRVLVVADDSDTRRMLKAVLSECHARVIIAASAAEAIEEIGRRKPDVLVSDLGMPEQDGYELIKKVRGWNPPTTRPGFPPSR
jgi:CheY-like chemotaxis protein